MNNDRPANIQQTDSWTRYRKGLCEQCQALCCSLPVEARFDDLVRMKLADDFERDEPLKTIAKRLMKQGSVAHFNARDGIFTLTQHSSGDCIFLDRQSRRCTIYALRPDTCRQHPAVGPKPGYCAYLKK